MGQEPKPADDRGWSASYFAKFPPPQTPQDLTSRECINIRMPTSKALQIWEFEKDGRELNVRVEGRFIFNTDRQRRDAAVGGHGLAYMLENHAREYIKDGRLVELLSDRSPPFPGIDCYLCKSMGTANVRNVVVGGRAFKGRLIGTERKGLLFHPPQKMDGLEPLAIKHHFDAVNGGSRDSIP